MGGSRFDQLARALAHDRTRRGLLGGLAALAAGIAAAERVDAAACPAGQYAGSGGRCLCRDSGRPPVGGACSCLAGQVRDPSGACCTPASCQPGQCGPVPSGDGCGGALDCGCCPDGAGCATGGQCCSGFCSFVTGTCTACVPNGTACDPDVPPETRSCFDCCHESVCGGGGPCVCCQTQTDRAPCAGDTDCCPGLLCGPGGSCCGPAFASCLVTEDCCPRLTCVSPAPGQASCQPATPAPTTCEVIDATTCGSCCGGCCDHSGGCQPGDADTACGASGNPCQDCTSGIIPARCGQDRVCGPGPR